MKILRGKMYEATKEYLRGQRKACCKSRSYAK